MNNNTHLESQLINQLQNNIEAFASKHSNEDADLQNLIIMNYSEDIEEIEILVRHCSSQKDFLRIKFDALLFNFSYETVIDEDYLRKKTSISKYQMLETYFYKVRNIFMQRDEEPMTYKIRTEENSSIEDNFDSVHQALDFTEHAYAFSHAHYDNVFLKITSEVLLKNLCFQLIFNAEDDYEIMLKEKDFVKNLMLLEHCQLTVLKKYHDAKKSHDPLTSNSNLLELPVPSKAIN